MVWKFISKSLACAAVALAAFSASGAGDKINFYNPGAKRDLSPPPARKIPKPGDSSLSPSLFPSDGINRISAPPSLPDSPARVPNKQEKDRAEKDKNWIFATGPEKKSDDQNTDEKSPEEALGIKDYLQFNAKNASGLRRFLEERTVNNPDRKKENEKEKDDKDWDTRGENKNQVEGALDSEMFSFKTFDLEKQYEKALDWEARRPQFGSFLTDSKDARVEERKKEEREQLNEFKVLLRPKNGGGSTGLYDSLNSDHSPSALLPVRSTVMEGLKATPSATPENPWFARPAGSATISGPSLLAVPERSSFLPGADAAGPSPVFSEPARVQPKPGVLPFPKRPGALF